MALDESVTSSFNVEEVDDTQDSIDSSLLKDNSNSFYLRGEHGYLCKVCNHKYASRRYVLFHLTNSHNIPTHSWPTCSQCGKIFTKPSKLAVHMINHPAKKKQDTSLSSPTHSKAVLFSPPHSVDNAPRIKIIKSPSADKVKQKTPKVKPLTVLFMRSSLPITYKYNLYKCGKCFKSFITETDRDAHRILIHEPIVCSEDSLKIYSDRGKGKRKPSHKMKKIKRLNKIKKKILKVSNKNRSLSSSKSSDKSFSKKSVSKEKSQSKRSSSSFDSHSKIRSKSLSHLETSSSKKYPSIHRSKSTPRHQSFEKHRHSSERSDSSPPMRDYKRDDPLDDTAVTSSPFSPSSPHGLNIEMECIPTLL